MRLVYLESPFAGRDDRERARNLDYARECVLSCLRVGEAPLASHLLYPQCLDDDVPEERRLGMEAGFAWAQQAEATVVFEDLGISRGMRAGIENAEHAGRTIEFRRLPGFVLAALGIPG